MYGVSRVYEIARGKNIACDIYKHFLKIRRDFSANPESEQLLFVEACDETSNTCVRLQPDERLSMNKLYLQGGILSSRPSLEDKSAALNHNAHIDESSNSPTAVITLPSIIANSNENNDDPPPYVAIPPPYSSITSPDHIGCPYGLFSFGDLYSTNGTRRMEIPLTPFQSYLTPTTGFHPEWINDQYAPIPLMPYRFFKFGCRRNFFVPRETDNEIAEKIDDTKSRRYGAILIAAAVIIFLMALSLIVRFVMEKSWWRR